MTNENEVSRRFLEMRTLAHFDQLIVFCGFEEQPAKGTRQKEGNYTMETIELLPGLIIDNGSSVIKAGKI